MKKLIFGTNNTNKLVEIKSVVRTFEVIGLKEMGIHEDIDETGTTLEENALIKSRYIYQKTGLDCFSDDTGLEIEALDGKPGVYSARYAGAECNSEANMQKVLKEIKGSENRRAQFRTVIALIIDGNEYFFEGKVDGEILKFRTGNDGFGYDPIFKPNGFNKSFAQMSIQQKNEISHRGLAVKQLINFLKE